MAESGVSMVSELAEAWSAKSSPEDLAAVSRLVLMGPREVTTRPLFPLRPEPHWPSPEKLFDEYVVEWQLSDAVKS